MQIQNGIYKMEMIENLVLQWPKISIGSPKTEVKSTVGLQNSKPKSIRKQYMILKIIHLARRFSLDNWPKMLVNES